MILTVDLGTTVVKVAAWDRGGAKGLARAALSTSRPRPGWEEQDPESWWRALVEATEQLRGAMGPAPIEAIGFAAARQTFVPVDATGETLGTALVWSDQRARAEAVVLAEELGGRQELWRRTGMILDGRSVAAKVAWLAQNEPGRLDRARWLLGPRDLVVARLTGEVCTDWTLASATGLYDFETHVVPELAGCAQTLLPVPRPCDAVAGGLRPEPAEVLGLPAGIPVILGAGDRACEALGAGATPGCPVVSWGTTANASLPFDGRPEGIPWGLAVTRATGGGWLLEAGLAGAGSILQLLSDLCGRTVEDLMALAAASPPGARGVVLTPWLGGARAPWWQDQARTALVGLSAGHTVGDLARAVLEGVAYELRRCLPLMATAAAGHGFDALALGAGSDLPLWAEVLTAVTACGGIRRSGLAASTGAALLTWGALGDRLSAEQLDPVVERIEPARESTAAYRRLTRAADGVAHTLVDLELDPTAE